MALVPEAILEKLEPMGGGCSLTLGTASLFCIPASSPIHITWWSQMHQDLRVAEPTPRTNGFKYAG